MFVNNVLIQLIRPNQMKKVSVWDYRTLLHNNILFPVGNDTYNY